MELRWIGGAIINIGTQKLSQKLVNRIFFVSHDSLTVNIYSKQEAVRAIAEISESGWVAPDGCFIDNVKYYRLKRNSPFLSPFSGKSVQCLYIKPNNADFIYQGIKRRDLIKCIQFHTRKILARETSETSMVRAVLKIIWL